MTEKGIKLDSFALTRMGRTEAVSAAEGYEWVYTGSEFCENLLSEADADLVMYFLKLRKKVVYSTPPLTDKGVAVTERILARLDRLFRENGVNREDFEISFNDMAVCLAVNENGYGFRLDAGRMIWKNVFVLDGHFNFYLVSRNEAEFFYGKGVYRYDLGLASKIPETNIKACRKYFPKLSVSLFYPYFALTSSRSCIIGNSGDRRGHSTCAAGCGKECVFAYFEAEHPFIKEHLFVRGNTLFRKYAADTESAASAGKLEEAGIDRIVYCPYP